MNPNEIPGDKPPEWLSDLIEATTAYTVDVLTGMKSFGSAVENVTAAFEGMCTCAMTEASMRACLLHGEGVTEVGTYGGVPVVTTPSPSAYSSALQEMRQDVQRLMTWPNPILPTPTPNPLLDDAKLTIRGTTWLPGDPNRTPATPAAPEPPAGRFENLDWDDAS